jgi:hypothetical protein
LNDDEDRWRDSEPPARGPSAPPSLRFDPFSTALGVFAAVAIPCVVIGYTRPSGHNGAIIALGIVFGLALGILVGLWVAGRDGRVWRGPQL